MKLNFNIKSEVNKKLTIGQLQLVLFRSMLKMQELATINAPFDTGRLSASIHLTPSVEGYSSYLLSDGVDYGVDVEFGTSPHIIKPKGNALKFKIDGKTIFSRKVMHPGTEAQPFFRPALDQVRKIWIPRFVDQTLSKKGNNI